MFKEQYNVINNDVNIEILVNNALLLLISFQKFFNGKSASRK